MEVLIPIGVTVLALILMRIDDKHHKKRMEGVYDHFFPDHPNPYRSQR